MGAKELFREGRLRECLAAVQADIRRDPSDAAHHRFLFQLLSVFGQWEKAAARLEVAAKLSDGDAHLLPVYKPLLEAEPLRQEVFAGRRVPDVLGTPKQWLADLITANRLQAQGESESAGRLREAALASAPDNAGAINGILTHNIADADLRLGPVLEVVIEGRYLWAPFDRVAAVTLDAPSTLADLIWAPARLMWSNGGQAMGFIPVRYPGSEASEDPAILLGRRTDWREAAPGFTTGLGQRLLADPNNDWPILELRELTLGAPVASAASTAH